MSKVLFKKQMMELFEWLYRDRKTGLNRKKSVAITYGILYFVLLYGFIGAMFFALSSSICKFFVDASLGWLYIVIMGTLSVLFGVFGSVFSTYASLYQSKDNEMLLSMPIPVRTILLTRISGVYIMGALYEFTVMIPALISWFMAGGSAWALLIPILLSILILTLSCFFGWIVALVSSKLKNNKILTVVLSLVLFGAYYYFCGNSSVFIEMLMNNAEAISGGVKYYLYPFYKMGLGASGDVLSMLIFAVIVLVLFVICYFILDRTFIGITTANKGVKKKEYKSKAMKSASVDGALLKKELFRFLGSTTYMLNCGLGLVLLPIVAVALLLNGGQIGIIFGKLAPYSDLVAVLTSLGAVCFTSSMCDISAPSVSLEGKNIWILQTLPVNPKQALMAKLKLHIYLTLPPVAVLLIAFSIVMPISWYNIILLWVAAISYVVFLGSFGLFVNLKSPNLDWTSEVVPIKQGLSVTVALFGGWGLALVIGGIFAGVAYLLNALAGLIVVCAIVIAASIWIIRWINTKGAVIFENL